MNTTKSQRQVAASKQRLMIKITQNKTEQAVPKRDLATQRIRCHHQAATNTPPKQRTTMNAKTDHTTDRIQSLEAKTITDMKPIISLLKLIPALLLCLLAGVNVQAQWQPELGPSAYSSLTWSELRNGVDAAFTIGRTTDNKVYVWGQNFYSEIHTRKIVNNDYQVQTTPFYVPLPAGEVAKKVDLAPLNNGAINGFGGITSAVAFACLTQSNKLYGWGINGGLFGASTTAFPITMNGTLTDLDTTRSRRRPVLITIPNETTVLDFALSTNAMVVVGGSGKAYYNGVHFTNGSPTYSSTFLQIKFPTGVTAFTRAWMPYRGQAQIFLKGNDNNIYAVGPFVQYFASGAAALNNTASYNYNLPTDTPQLVPFPAGEDITELYPGGYTTLALSSSGKAYGTGIWYSTRSDIVGGKALRYPGLYTFPLKTPPVPADLTVVTTATDTTKFTNKFLEIALTPGATKFISLENASIPGYAPTMYFVGDNNKVYWRGISNRYTMQNFLEYPTEPNINSRCQYVDSQWARPAYSYAEEAINLQGATKVFFRTSGTGGVGFVLSKSYRGYVFGPAAAYVSAQGKSDGSAAYPTPIANELLDYCNPSPGIGGTGGTSTGATSATGVINCAKTQLAPAPVVGALAQTGLIVTIAVSATGTFSPITVSGSGMSVANGITALTASATGTQQFYIPLQYDGTALGTLNFTIGTATNAGSCAANLSSPPKQAITNIWTLDCVPTVGPTLKK